MSSEFSVGVDRARITNGIPAVDLPHLGLWQVVVSFLGYEKPSSTRRSDRIHRPVHHSRIRADPCSQGPYPDGQAAGVGDKTEDSDA